MSDTGEDSALHVHILGLFWRKGSLSFYNSFTWKIVLKCSFIGDTGGRLYMIIVQVFWETALQVGSYSWEMFLK